MKSKILILNGTISEIPIIQKAQEMGFHVVTTGNMPDLPGHKVADEYIPEDYSNYEAVLKLVQENGIQGIVSCANDFGVITSSYVAEKMGWKGHDTFANSCLMHHKDSLMEYFLKKGFPVAEFKNFDDENSAIEYCRTAKFPLVVKASDLTGGKGIERVDTIEQAKDCIKKSFAISRRKHVVIQRYLGGVQQSIVCFLAGRKIIKTSSSNIYCMRNPYLVQAETYPAENFELVRPELHRIIEAMAEDLNLADGIFSFQYIVEDGVPYVIDMMRRCFGNETLLLADEMTGFPWEEAYIRASLGLDCSNLECKPTATKFCGHFGIMADRNGILRSYAIPADIESRVFKKTELLKPGDRIENFLVDKIALFYFRYADMKQMNEEIVQYNDRIKICLE